MPWQPDSLSGSVGLVDGKVLRALHGVCSGCARFWYLRNPLPNRIWAFPLPHLLFLHVYVPLPLIILAKHKDTVSLLVSLSRSSAVRTDLSEVVIRAIQLIRTDCWRSHWWRSLCCSVDWDDPLVQFCLSTQYSEPIAVGAPNPDIQVNIILELLELALALGGRSIGSEACDG